MRTRDVMQEEVLKRIWSVSFGTHNKEDQKGLKNAVSTE
jgi:hypothetical protein